MFISSMRTSIVMLLAFTVLTGLAYPAVTTVILQGLFHDKANGSLITDNSGTIHGSALIGQNFTEPKYFWGRLSATSPVPYNAAASSGSNLGAANPSLQDAVKARIAAARADAETIGKDKIPVDLVTTSGSGLDPNITMAAAFYQIPRVAKARGLSQERIRELIKQNTEKRQFGLLGEPRVNVLQLNLALDKE